MTPKQLLAIVVARWRLAVLMLVLSVGAAAAVSLTMLKQYSAVASVLIDTRSTDQIAGGALSGGGGAFSAGYIATQVDLIMSERVARGVIRALHLAEDVGLRERWLEAGAGRGNFQAWIAEEVLQKNLTVRPAPVSNVVTIGYSARDAQHAAQVANAFVQAYVDASLELRMERIRQYGSFFDERAKQLRAELAAGQAKLSEYQQKHGLLTGNDRLDVETSRLGELAAQLMQLQSSNAELAGRAKHAGQQAEQLPEIQANPMVAALNNDLTREETRMQELVSRLGDAHPQLVEQRARVTELKSRLAAATARATASVGISSSVSQGRLAQTAAALEAQRTRVLRIQGLRDQAVTLQRDVENAQKAYDEMLSRVSQSTLESRNTYTNVTVLKHATPPMGPSSPNALKNIATGLALGVLLGIGACVGLELLDRRMRTSDDVAELKQPLLVSLPVSAHARRAVETSRVRMMKQRIMTGLPRPKQQI